MCASEAETVIRAPWRRSGKDSNTSKQQKGDLVMSYQFILVDDPRPLIRRVTLNRPDKRNALNNQLRTEILQALEERIVIQKCGCDQRNRSSANRFCQPRVSRGRIRDLRTGHRGTGGEDSHFDLSSLQRRLMATDSLGDAALVSMCCTPLLRQVRHQS
jgi:1,4-dihydroxy-2-naphthoyl-CoA synthase